MAAFSQLGPSQGALSAKVGEAIEAGEKFVEIFYETFDRRRQLIAGLYSDVSFVVWNGHTKSGAVDISTFYQSLPGSEHSLLSYDCQPVADNQGQTTVLVSCEGVVKFDGHSNDQELFSQNFLLTKQGDVWKIGSDCFRFLDQL